MKKVVIFQLFEIKKCGFHSDKAEMLNKKKEQKNEQIFFFIFLYLDKKIKEIQSKTQEKSLKKQTMAHLDDFSFLTRGARKFYSLQKERAEKSANFLFLIFIFGPKTKEIRSKTLEKKPKKQTLAHSPATC